jgi:hypothetical protein
MCDRTDTFVKNEYSANSVLNKLQGTRTEPLLRLQLLQYPNR